MSTPSRLAVVLSALVLAVALAPAQQNAPVSNRAGANPPVAQQAPPRTLPGSKPGTAPPRATPKPPAAAAPKPTKTPTKTPTPVSRVVYVKTPDAPIRATTGGGVIATAQQGAALSVVSDDKLQFKVRLSDGREGVIAKRLVQDKPPSRGGLGIVVADDRKGSEMGTGASARGLNEQAKTVARQEGVEERAIASVESMEKLNASITDADVANFAKQGGLEK